MPISRSDQLFSLIKSLSRAEKKAFTVYASRLQDSDSLMYIQLFDLIEKAKLMDDETIIKKLGQIDKSKYSNLKRHLYKQILISLRLIFIHRKAVIEIREFIDFSDILYTKGLILQSLKMLHMARNLAQKAKATTLEMIIVEKLKKIESRNITRSGHDIVLDLTSDAEKLSNTVYNSVKLSNFKITLHGYYIKFGHVQNKDDLLKLNHFYNQVLPDLQIDTLTYLEKIYFFQSMVWYHYILLDFKQCYDYALQWVSIMQEHPYLLDQDPDLLMRGYHYLLTAAYFIIDKVAYQEHFDRLSEFRLSHYKKFSYQSQITSFVYVHHARYNFHFLHESYSEAVSMIPRTIRRINRYKDKLDNHRIMVFYYKIAFTYLMTRQYKRSIDYLHQIISMEVGQLREDIQGYSRLMYLMAHYSADSTSEMDYLIKNVEHFFRKANISKFQKTILSFFKEVSNLPLLERKERLLTFEKEISLFKDDYFEQKAFLYLDVMSWVRLQIGR